MPVTGTHTHTHAQWSCVAEAPRAVSIEICITCTRELVHLSTSVCLCIAVSVCVHCTQGCLTPNRCHYFPLSSTHPSVSAEVFFNIPSVLFSEWVCAQSRGARVPQEGRAVCVCSRRAWVGGRELRETVAEKNEEGEKKKRVSRRSLVKNNAENLISC